MAPSPIKEPPFAELGSREREEGAPELEDTLNLLFNGRVAEVLPAEEMGEFHDFIRGEALRQRRFAISFRVACGCLAWIGYALTKVVTREDGLEFTARALRSYIPDHEADSEHPQGPSAEQPLELDDWPVWPFEIYQDELEEAEAGIHENLAELAVELEAAEGDVGRLKALAAREESLRSDDLSS